MIRPRASFRAKILLALVGTVVVLLGTSLLAIGRQTAREVREAVDAATARSTRAFADVLELRGEERERIARRFSGGPRLAAAMDAALLEGESGVLEDVAAYELELADLSDWLLGFRDLDGQEVLLLKDGEALAARTATEAGAGYVVVGETLFATHSFPLDLQGVPIGTMSLGFPLDDEVARGLGQVVGAELCFVVAGRCLAGTPATHDPDLGRGLMRAAGERAPVRTEWDGRRWALVSAPLPGQEAEEVAQAMAIPLDGVLRPFDRIRRAQRLAGLAALLLALVAGTTLSRGLAGPLRTLVRATERVRRGDYDFRVEVPSRDELGDLAGAFNEMVGDLALKERYRGVLEKAVSRDVAEEMMRGEIGLGGEAREVTTLFADLRDFTSLTAGLSSQEVIALLNEWFDEAARAIDAEGGVVDKFLGDGIMAVFGAPMAQPDHAARAVRAATGLRAATETLNARRREREEPPLGVGIGLASGSVVAGNTGSPTRMNYTVLGGPVNLAARLCSEAGPGEVLLAESTLRAAGSPAGAEPAAPRRLKGIAEEVRPWRLPAAATIAACVMLLLGPGLVNAQGWPPDPPTLVEAGIRYVSPSGTFQLLPSGRLELDGHVPGDEPAWLVPETDAFAAGRLRIFLDAFAGERLFASVEARADRGEAPASGSLEARIQQAFVRLALTGGGGLHVQAGKFIAPFGGYPSRAGTTADPFLRPPLAYDHRTTLTSQEVPGGQVGFLTWKDRPDEFRHRGAPVVWATPYPTGAMLGGLHGRAALRVAVVNSAPSAEPRMWDPGRERTGPWTLQARAELRIVPELQVGASASTGGYLEPDAVGLDALEGDARTHEQALIGADATVARGRVEMRGEVIRGRWRIPNVEEDALDTSWFAEARLRSGGGHWGAVRYGRIHFGTLAGEGGAPEVWDYDASRWQLAAGTRISRNLDVRAEALVNRFEGGPAAGTELFSVRLGWTF